MQELRGSEIHYWTMKWSHLMGFKLRTLERGQCFTQIWDQKLGFSCGSVGKESTCNAGDLGLIPGLGRSSGEGKGYPLQYSGLEYPMDCIVHGVTKSQTRLSNFHSPYNQKLGQTSFLVKVCFVFEDVTRLYYSLIKGNVAGILLIIRCSFLFFPEAATTERE